MPEKRAAMKKWGAYVRRLLQRKAFNRRRELAFRGGGMFNVIFGWIERRREIRRRWQSDGRRLINEDERGAYYAEQRLAARCRAQHDRAGFWHWAKVASEVARISSIAEMDRAIVERIADEELRTQRSAPRRND